MEVSAQMNARDQRDYEELLAELKEPPQEQLQNDSRKYMLDDSTYIVKYANSSFWNWFLQDMFGGTMLWIVLTRFIDKSNFLLIVSLLVIIAIVIFLEELSAIYRRITFNTATGEMTYRRLFRPTWRFRREDITSMEVKLDNQLRKYSRLHIYVDNRKIQIDIGRINQTVMESGNPGGIDKSIGRKSNIFELMEFLNVWERAAITDLFTRRENGMTANHQN